MFYNGTQQYGMVKGTEATPKCLLFIVTQIEKSRLSNRTVSALVLLKLTITNGIQLSQQKSLQIRTNTEFHLNIKTEPSTL